LPPPTRQENCFFRDMHAVGTITKEVLRERTIECHQWVEAFRNHHVSIEWAELGLRKRGHPRPRLQQGERRQRCGRVFHSEDHGGRHQLPGGGPKYPTADAEYRIITRQLSRYTYYYFYVRDQQSGNDRAVRRLLPAVSITYYSEENPQMRCSRTYTPFTLCRP
jgi:hypothetical protein